MKKLNKTTMALVALAAAAALQTAQAGLTTDTLSDLQANGGSLSIGDKTFSGFASSPVGLTSFDASQITVTASVGTDGTYYLAWTGNMSLAGSGTAPTTADLLLQYVVTASAGSISMIDQSYTGSGTLKIDETVATGSQNGPIVAQSDLTGTFNSDFTGANLNVDPSQSVLYVTKDISFTADGLGDTTTVSRVSQSFHQTSVPEPSTVTAGVLLLLPFGVSTMRILRKKKVS